MLIAGLPAGFVGGFAQTLLACTVASGLHNAVARAETLQHRVNGVPIHTREFRVVGAPIPVAGRLADRWRREGASPVSVHRHAAGVVVGRQLGPLHQSVLLRPDATTGMSSVLVSVLDLGADQARATFPKFALPHGFRLLSTVESCHVGDCSVQYLLGDRRAPAVSVAALQARLVQTGWQVNVAAHSPAWLGARRDSDRLDAFPEPVDGATVWLLLQRKAGEATHE